jgi:hypothetical protein
MSEYVDIMLLGVTGVDFNEINQLLIINSVVVKYFRNCEECNGTVYKTFTDSNKVYGSVRRETLTVLSLYVVYS